MINIAYACDDSYPPHTGISILSLLENNLKVKGIHYLAGWFKRPLEIGCSHPLKGQYLAYKAKSKWKDEPLIKKNLPEKIRFLKILSRLMLIKLVQYTIAFYTAIK